MDIPFQKETIKMIEDCIQGKHELKEITILSHWDGSSQVVRWCGVCGSIVIDTQVDKRIFPGAVKPMEYPELFKEKFKK